MNVKKEGCSVIPYMDKPRDSLYKKEVGVTRRCVFIKNGKYVALALAPNTSSQPITSWLYLKLLCL